MCGLVGEVLRRLVTAADEVCKSYRATLNQRKRKEQGMFVLFYRCFEPGNGEERSIKYTMRRGQGVPRSPLCSRSSRIRSLARTPWGLGGNNKVWSAL